MNSQGLILRNVQSGMKIYLYFQPWKEETWDSQNNLTGKQSNVWECWDTLRVVVPVNSWKSVQGGSECQILPSTRTNAHTYMNLNTREFQYTHVSRTHTFTWNYENNENQTTSSCRLWAMLTQTKGYKSATNTLTCACVHSKHHTTSHIEAYGICLDTWQKVNGCRKYDIKIEKKEHMQSQNRKLYNIFLKNRWNWR